MGPLRSGHSAAAVVVAAAGAVECKMAGLGAHGNKTLVCLTEAAGMERRSRDGERHRNKISGKREQKQKSGGQPLHGFEVKRSPRFGKHRTQ